MSSQIIDVRLGPFRFSTYNPQVIAGPNREAYIVTHQVPGKEGGIVEYLGLAPKDYTIRGFLTPRQILTDASASILSGVAVVNLTSDDAKDALIGLQGSGALLLKFESTYSNYSGYPVLFENDFFFIRNLNFGLEAGKIYPYYPYTLGLQRATPRLFGFSGITADWNPTGMYFSGYIIGVTNNLIDNLKTSGNTVNSLGFYASAINSGNAKMALYRQVGATGSLLVETASQAVHSGWNWFPVNPSHQTSAGVSNYTLCIKSDAAGVGAWTVRGRDSSVDANNANTQSYQSGVSYGPAFPSTFQPGTFASASGFGMSLQMVASQ